MSTKEENTFKSCLSQLFVPPELLTDSVEVVLQVPAEQQLLAYRRESSVLVSGYSRRGMEA